MNDYRLDRLSPRLFEHIIQALATSCISANLTPFGDGPDGGREATFEGDTHYQVGSTTWVGYGVLQAKYRTRPENTTKDGAWALNELKKELAAYSKKRKSPRRIPEYYIFATNVTLAPGTNGPKDSIKSLLAKFKDDNNLKGYDIWDYDKLRVLLDSNEPIRRSYMAWILPSDVLSALCDYLGERKRDYYKLLIRYLQRELVSDQYAQLEQAGHTADEAIQLSQVFIDLPTSLKISTSSPRQTDDLDEPRFVSRIINDTALSLRTTAQAADPSIASTAVHQQQRFGKYVLIGGPGQGKTTVAQYICQIFRCALLADVPQSRIDVEAAATLADLIKQWTTSGNTMPAARRLPFRIVLSDFARSLASGQIESLMGYLALKICAKSDIKINAEEFERILTTYPSIVILDGLDEVPASTNRDDVLKAVTNFSIDVATGDLDIFLIATTRPQGYNKEFSPRQYVHHYLTPLLPSDALTYGDRLARIRFGSNDDRFEKVSSRLRRALRKPATAKLMETPLQVTILTLLVDRVGDPPEERWSLFREYYQLIYDRETERDIPSVAILRDHRNDIDAIHGRVGIALQVESERSGGTDARLSVDQFGAIVEAYLIEEGHEGDSLSSLKDQVIEAAANRLVFLVGLESGLVGFEIRSLQEFMAAEGMVDGEDEAIQRRLREIAPSSHWRNVFLFAAGKCFSDRRHLRDTFQAICAELNDYPDNEGLRTVLAGSELALDLLEDGPARKVPLTRAPLTRLALQLLDVPFDGTSRLAAVCEPETAYMYLECLSEKIAATSGGPSDNAIECLALLTDRFGEKFENLSKQLLSAGRISAESISTMAYVATGVNEWQSQMLYERLAEDGLQRTSYMVNHITTASSGESIFGPWPLSKYPKWLEWYAQYSVTERIIREPSSQLRIEISSRRSYYARFNLLENGAPNWLRLPRDLPNTAGWQPFRTLAIFYQSPSPDTLADAVVATKQMSQAWQHLTPFSHSWVLSELLMASSTGPDSQLAEWIRSGGFGDAKDWVERERQFVAGQSIDQIRAYAPLFDAADGGIFAFPFRCTRWWPILRTSGDVPLAVIEAFDNHRTKVDGKFWADVALHFAGAVSSAKIAEWIERVLILACLDESYVDSNFYQYVEFLDLGNPVWSKIFSTYPVDSLRLSGKSSNPKAWAVTVVEVLDKRPELSGLLVPLASGLLDATVNARRPYVRVCRIATDSSVVVQVAAIVMNVMAGISVDEMRTDIGRTISADRQVLSLITRAVVSCDYPYERERDELLTLLSLPEVEKWNMWGPLHSNFTRRRTALGSPRTWLDLALPPSISTVLERGTARRSAMH